ncbi:hypothetical protein [Aeromonas veronii]|uniref:HEAT repeat domain-containing protein n=1 Tax=Aeromonas veronii TaxID=654 RepID=A0A4S5CK45_AERVE|nr:hypothetical protein [Aeromonas veronii]THJ44983.1 hypothetical protein E8Q35_12400 [Aeromonas veronii]
MTEQEKITLASAEQQMQLAKDPSFFSRIKLAQDPSCSADALALLAFDEDCRIRRVAIKNPYISVDLLCELSVDPVHDVRGSIAELPDCPMDLLHRFVNDDAMMVRKSVASNPNCPVELMSKLLNDADGYVRWCLAGNQSLPYDLVKIMTKDKDTEVREMIAIHPKLDVFSLLNMALTERSKAVLRSVYCALGKIKIEVWSKAVTDGLSLSQPSGKTGRSKSVGDKLLGAGLENVYQLIQSAELSQQISLAADLQHTIASSARQKSSALPSLSIHRPKGGRL